MINFASVRAVIFDGTAIETIVGLLTMIGLCAAIFGLVLTLLTGMAQSAHDGATLTARYRTAWPPLRAMLGLAFLTPVLGGYCLLQRLVLGFGEVGSARRSRLVRSPRAPARRAPAPD